MLQLSKYIPVNSNYLSLIYTIKRLQDSEFRASQKVEYKQND